MLTVVHDAEASNEDGATAAGGSLLDEIARDGARAMLAEVAAYIDAHRGEVDQAGHRLGSANGYHAERKVTTAGAVPVRTPRRSRWCWPRTAVSRRRSARCSVTSPPGWPGRESEAPASPPPRRSRLSYKISGGSRL